MSRTFTHQLEINASFKPPFILDRNALTNICYLFCDEQQFALDLEAVDKSKHVPKIKSSPNFCRDAKLIVLPGGTYRLSCILARPESVGQLKGGFHIESGSAIVEIPIVRLILAPVALTPQVAIIHGSEHCEIKLQKHPSVPADVAMELQGIELVPPFHAEFNSEDLVLTVSCKDTAVTEGEIALTFAFSQKEKRITTKIFVPVRVFP